MRDQLGVFFIKQLTGLRAMRRAAGQRRGRMWPALAQQRQHLQQAIARQPSDFVAWVMLADLELEAGDIAAGEQAARRALQLRPNHPEALARLGRVAWMAGAHADAATLLGQAAALAPQHPGIALWLGHALEDADDAEGAAAAYRRAHALMPSEPYIAAQRLAWQRRLCDWQDVDAMAAQVRTKTLPPPSSWPVRARVHPP
ncbi:hypothetical protein G6F24_013868 [Rhizopus arrhizus]|nr:hypothetical protein G6F24_013868 [Rhizopus arrhizus]